MSERSITQDSRFCDCLSERPSVRQTGIPSLEDTQTEWCELLVGLLLGLPKEYHQTQNESYLGAHMRQPCLNKDIDDLRRGFEYATTSKSLGSVPT